MRSATSRWPSSCSGSDWSCLRPLACWWPAGWRAGGLGRVSALVVGTGLVLYLPQFFGSAEVRILHGALLAVGGVLIGVAVSRARPAAKSEAAAEP